MDSKSLGFDLSVFQVHVGSKAGGPRHQVLYNFTHFREQSSRKCVKFALKRGFSSDFHEFPRFFFLFRRVFHEFARGLKKKNEKVGRKMRYPI